MAQLETAVELGSLTLRNRLYRAPLLECAGTGPGAGQRLREHLEPAAAAGAGLVIQGATVVTADGGCAAPQMTRIHDADAAAALEPVPDAIQAHDSHVFIQLGHGGLRSLEAWHHQAREAAPDTEQLAVSTPPAPLRLLDRVGILSLSPRVLSTAGVYELAEQFGKAAERAVAVGYDGIHLSGANMSIIQQFLSLYYNNRSDEFGGSVRNRVRFLEEIHDAIRRHAGDVPLLTKVPCESAAPPFARPRIDIDDTVQIARHLDNCGFDALAPVRCSTFWDASIIRGEYPETAWNATAHADGYEAAFGGPVRAKLVELLTRLDFTRMDSNGPWNIDLCRRVRNAVNVPVLCEGGIRSQAHIDRILSPTASDPAADLVGLGRPFYAEPRLPALLLESEEARVACQSCNNCTVPQVTGADGVCRTPSVLATRGRRERRGTYESN